MKDTKRKKKQLGQCVILNVNASAIYNGHPISHVCLTAAKLDRDKNRNGNTKTIRRAFMNLQKDFTAAKKEYFASKDTVTNQEYVDFINNFLRLRAMDLETSEERMKRRLKI